MFRRGIGRRKHVEVRQLWLQDTLHKGRLQIEKVKGELNPADYLVKRFTAARHEWFAAEKGGNAVVHQLITGPCYRDGTVLSAGIASIGLGS